MKLKFKKINLGSRLNIKTKFDFLINNFSTIITTVATCVLAYYAVMGHMDTQSIINQQKRSDAIQFRAYLGVTGSLTRETSLENGDPYELKLNFSIKNNGQTPAAAVSTKLLWNADGVLASEAESSKFILNPGEFKNVPLVKDYNFFEKFTKDGSNNYILFQVNYFDYQNEQHQYEVKYYTARSSQGSPIDGLIVFDETAF